MKKVIDGKTYNTDTAKFIGSYRTSLSRRDFNYYEEELYLTKKGTYFLSGEGGPMTHYAQRTIYGTWCSGHSVRVISLVEAQEWVKNCMSDEAYHKLFEM